MTDKKQQRDRFIAAARDLGADEDRGAFRERLKRLVAAPPNRATPRNLSEHDSDCAVHNGPAFEAGPCDCSLSKSRK